MVTWKDFTIHSVQTVIFTPDHSAFVGSRVVATIVRQFGDLFSGDMQVLPVSQDVPPEFPAVVLKSGDGSQEVNAGRGRFNCVWKATGPEASVTLREALDRCVPVLQHYVRETNVGVGRLGLVVQRVCPNDAPALTLNQQPRSTLLSASMLCILMGLTVSLRTLTGREQSLVGAET